MNLDQILFGHRLVLDSEYQKTASRFCNIVGSKTSKTKERYLLGSWYEGYIYCCLLGIKLGNVRQKSIGNRDTKRNNWSHNYLKQYKYLLLLLISRDDVKRELNIHTKDAIKNNFEGLESTFGQLKEIADEYCWGGLSYLKDKYENDETIFDNYDSLKLIMENVQNNDSQ